MFVGEKWRAWWQPVSGCSREEVLSPFFLGSSWAVYGSSPCLVAHGKRFPLPSVRAVAGQCWRAAQEQCFPCKLKGLSLVLAMQNIKSGTCLWSDTCVPHALLLLKERHVTRLVTKAQATPIQNKRGHVASNSYHCIWGDLFLCTCSTVWIKAMPRR